VVKNTLQLNNVQYIRDANGASYAAAYTARLATQRGN